MHWVRVQTCTGMKRSSCPPRLLNVHCNDTHIKECRIYSNAHIFNTFVVIVYLTYLIHLIYLAYLIYVLYLCIWYIWYIWHFWYICCTRLFSILNTFSTFFVLMYFQYLIYLTNLIIYHFHSAYKFDFGFLGNWTFNFALKD